MSRPVSDVIDANERGWRPSRRGDVDRAVRSAGRHSIVVRVTRIGLPIAVVAGLAAVGAATYFKPMQVFDKMPSVSGKLAVQGSKITMELPRIVGFTRDKRSYELNAETAVQDITSPDIVELQNLRARLEMQDKDVVNVTANSGTYSTKADKVVLRDQVVVTSQQGYKAMLREAAIEMKKGQRRFRASGRHHLAERLAQVEPHGDRRFRRCRPLRARRRSLHRGRQKRRRLAMRALRSFHVAFAGVALVLGAAIAAAAQPAQKDQPGGAMQGMQLNRDQPVKIESDALEVRDKSQQATFIGKVKLTQGDTILQCARLVIFYEDGSAAPAQKKGSPQTAQKGAPAPTAQKGGAGLGGGGQQIKRAEARGDVLVTQKDQTAKGDNGIFDVKANTVTLTGNVVVTQGANVLRGDRMVVDLTTGVARVESGQSKTGERQRVEGLFNPSTTPQPQPQPAPPPQNQKAPAPPPAAKSSPSAPTRIN